MAVRFVPAKAINCPGDSVGVLNSRLSEATVNPGFVAWASSARSRTRTAADFPCAGNDVNVMRTPFLASVKEVADLSLSDQSSAGTMEALPKTTAPGGIRTVATDSAKTGSATPSSKVTNPIAAAHAMDEASVSGIGPLDSGDGPTPRLGAVEGLLDKLHRLAGDLPFLISRHDQHPNRRTGCGDIPNFPNRPQVSILGDVDSDPEDL